MLFIKGGNILTMAGKEIEGGDILVEEGKIKQIGTNLNVPEGARVVDATGKTVMPGMIDPHTHLGIFEEGMGFEGNDTNELTNPITPELRAIDGINPYDEGFVETRKAGITSCVIAPGSGNVIGGQAAALKTMGKTVESMIIKNPVGLKIAFGENPKRVYAEKNKMPMTRMATAAMLRKALVDAQNYQSKLKKAEEDPDKAPDRDLQKEILIEVLEGRLPLKAHAHRADDIITALRIAGEFNLKISIEHCTEGHKIAEILKNEDIPAVVGPTMTGRSKIELQERTFDTPKALYEAGVKFAITTDHPVIPAYTLPICAALARKAGLPNEEALKAITINAAEIGQISDRVGSLEEGKDADILVFDGDPLAVESKLLHIFICGEEVTS